MILDRDTANQSYKQAMSYGNSLASSQMLGAKSNPMTMNSLSNTVQVNNLMSTYQIPSMNPSESTLVLGSTV